MRTIKFRDILWGVAYKLGLDPEQGNFLTNQAIPLGTFIDQWVHRTYDALDWPELTKTNQFAPANHIVPWDATPPAGDDPIQIGRVLKVYLIDPRTTNAPVSTRFDLLESGIHCGHDHGSSVWIRNLAPAPRFTAEAWDAGRTYAKDEVTYSPRSGECYLSKSDGNLNIDPSVAVGPGQPPIVEVTQNYIPPVVGTPGQSKRTILNITQTTPPFVIPDPAPVMDTWNMVILDATGAPIAMFAYQVLVSPRALSTVLSDLRTQLDTALPVSFLVTSNALLYTITMEDNSDFQVNAATMYMHEGKTYLLNYQVSQLFIPPISSDPGQPQIIRLTMTEETTSPGATYRLVLLDSSAATHTVEYESNVFDSAGAILNGLVLAIQTSTDPYWVGVQLAFDPSGPALDFIVSESFSLQPSIVLQESPWWHLVAFPRVLAEQVMRGGYADLLKEWGQTDKGLAEEQAVPQESTISSNDFTPTPNPPLSGQQVANSRYKI